MSYDEIGELSLPEKEIISLRKELKRCEQWVNDLQSGMYINCVYCGHRYGPKEDTPSTMADLLKDHIEQCSKHPLSKEKEDREKAEADVAALREDLLECGRLAGIVSENSARIPASLDGCIHNMLHLGWKAKNIHPGADLMARMKKMEEFVIKFDELMEMEDKYVAAWDKLLPSVRKDRAALKLKGE